MATATHTGRPEDRREPRYSTRVQAALLTYRHREAVTVENVSRSGALILCETPPERGAEVVLSAGSLEIVATVAWVSDHACGLMFHRTIDANALKLLRTA